MNRLIDTVTYIDQLPRYCRIRITEYLMQQGQMSFVIQYAKFQLFNIPDDLIIGHNMLVHNRHYGLVTKVVNELKYNLSHSHLIRLSKLYWSQYTPNMIEIWN